MKPVLIKNFKIGANIYGFYICKKIECKLTRLGDEYLDLLLQDKTGLIRGKVWSNVSEFKSEFFNNDIVAVKGSVIEYNKVKEINIFYLNKASTNLYSKYGFNKDNLIIKISESISTLEKFLYESINNKELKTGKEIKILIKNNFDKISKIPSLNKPYDLSGGFLLELVHLLKLNKKLPKIFNDKDESLIIIGIIIKNIGLLQYFNDDIQFSISELGKESSLKLLTLNIIDYYYKQNDSLKIKLQNFVLSEHKNIDVNLKFVESLYDFNNSINALN
ncbi:MAG: hypothetical protein CMG09_04185 [Candidatus Marinimicrobia bacterium]|nr:hypothetical protein [Candidatus Neomarinimicrobiota bacterium]